MMGDAIAVARLGPGKSIGPYIVLTRRGVGRSGVLYHAYESRTEEHVAIRLLPPQEPKSRDADTGELKAIEQLRREAEELAAIRHRHLVGIHEVGVLHGVVYLVMDYLGGGTFSAWLGARRRSWREIVACLADVGGGLAALHHAGLVHRDVRPANILFDDEGRPKLVDYAFHRGGFSSRRNTVLTKREEDETSAESLNAPLIRMGTWIGTPAYMAPEQYAGEELDGRADQFAFCVMLFEALYGRRPFEARTLDGMFLAVEEGRLTPVDSRGVPKRIHRVLVRGLAHDPAERWPSMDAMLDALSTEPNPVWRRRAAVAALITSLVAAFVAVSLRGPMLGSASQPASPVDVELDRVQTLIESNAIPEATEALTGVPAETLRAAARTFATSGNGAIYYGLGVTEHSQGSTTVMGIANLAMLTGNVGRKGVGVNPLRGQNNVQGSCDMGSFPHELPGYRHVKNPEVRAIFESLWGVEIDAEPGLRIPNMLDAAVEGSFKGLYCQGEDILQSDPDTKHVAAGLAAMDCVIVHDLFLNETANYAHVFLPGSTFLEKDGTFTNAERRINRVRKVMAPRNGYADWEITQMLANAMLKRSGDAGWTYTHPAQIMAEIAATTPSFAGVTYDLLEEMGSVQWPCNEKSPDGTPLMHVDGFVRGKGRFIVTEYVATDEKTGPRFPLLLTTGRILSQYNVGAQTRRTENVVWHDQDVLEIHPHDAENRGIEDGAWIRLASRSGETTLRAKITDRVSPGVVYTTFHHPDTQANVITTDFSDWATNCPEYKVTAVQVSLSNGPTEWQEDYAAQAALSRRILPAAE